MGNNFLKMYVSHGLEPPVFFFSSIQLLLYQMHSYLFSALTIQMIPFLSLANGLFLILLWCHLTNTTFLSEKISFFFLLLRCTTMSKEIFECTKRRENVIRKKKKKLWWWCASFWDICIIISYIYICSWIISLESNTYRYTHEILYW